jgi:hypothetical protein
VNTQRILSTVYDVFTQLIQTLTDKVLTSTLSLVLPVASSATKLWLDDATYKGIEKELDLGQKSLDAVLKGGEKMGSWLGQSDAPDLEHAKRSRRKAQSCGNFTRS